MWLFNMLLWSKIITWSLLSGKLVAMQASAAGSEQFFSETNDENSGWRSDASCFLSNSNNCCCSGGDDNSDSSKSNSSDDDSKSNDDSGKSTNSTTPTIELRLFTNNVSWEVCRTDAPQKDLEAWHAMQTYGSGKINVARDTVSHQIADAIENDFDIVALQEDTVPFWEQFPDSRDLADDPAQGWQCFSGGCVGGDSVMTLQPAVQSALTRSSSKNGTTKNSGQKEQNDACCGYGRYVSYLGTQPALLEEVKKYNKQKDGQVGLNGLVTMWNREKLTLVRENDIITMSRKNSNSSCGSDTSSTNASTNSSNSNSCTSSSSFPASISNSSNSFPKPKFCVESGHFNLGRPLHWMLFEHRDFPEGKKFLLYVNWHAPHYAGDDIVPPESVRQSQYAGDAGWTTQQMNEHLNDRKNWPEFLRKNHLEIVERLGGVIAMGDSNRGLADDEIVFNFSMTNLSTSCSGLLSNKNISSNGCTNNNNIHCSSSANNITTNCPMKHVKRINNKKKYPETMVGLVNKKAYGRMYGVNEPALSFAWCTRNPTGPDSILVWFLEGQFDNDPTNTNSTNNDIYEAVGTILEAEEERTGKYKCYKNNFEKSDFEKKLRKSCTSSSTTSSLICKHDVASGKRYKVASDHLPVRAVIKLKAQKLEKL